MKKLAAVLVVALLGFSWAAVHFWQELSAQRGRNQALAAGAANQARPVSGAGVSVGNTPSEAGAAGGNGGDTSAAAARALPVVAVSTGSAATTPPASGSSPAAQMLRSALERQFPDVAVALGLTPEEVDRLFELLARRNADLGTDRLQMLSQGNDGAARESVAARIARKEQAYEGELESLLGGKYGQWKDYQRSAGRRQVEQAAREQMEGLRQAVSPPGRRLDDQRLQALNTALEAEQRRLDRARSNESAQQRAQRLDEDRRQLLAVATEHLDAEELRGYERYLDGQIGMMRMMIGAMGAAGVDASRSPTPPPAP